MKYLKLILKNIGIMLAIIMIGTFFITLLNYFNLLSGSFFSLLKIIIVLISMIVGGFLTGKKSNSKGWLEGIKLGMIMIILMILINIIFIKEINLKNFIYYFILLICSILGSMIGISKKIEN